MQLVPVGNLDDDRVSVFARLTDAELRRRRELEAGGRGVFIAEGVLVIRHLLRLGHPLRSVLVTPKRLAQLAPGLDPLDIPVYVAEQAVMDGIVGFSIHRGAVAAAERPEPIAAADLLAGARRVAVLERVNDAENLGAIFRNAAALGMDAVLLSPDCCDPLYRRAVRVSMGHVLTLPFAHLTPWPAALGALRAARFLLVALTPDPAAEVLDALDPGLDRIALLVGAEGPGLSAEALAAADRHVRIPMVRAVDSLNVATAAAIAFHHAARPGRKLC